MKRPGVSTLRHLSQAAFFLLTGQWLLIGFLRCPFGVPFVSCAACPLGDCSGRFLFFPVFGLALIGMGFAGRVFCGWMCPLGYVQDVLSWLRPGSGLSPEWLLRPEARRLRWSKYLVLFLVTWWVVRFNILPARAYPYVVRSPSSANWESVAVAWRIGAWRYPARGILLLVILLGGLLVPRFWCRFLCPLGALLSVGNRFSWFRLRRNPAVCSGCGKYPRECVQGTAPGTDDCVLCGDCVGGCPVGAIALEKRGKTAEPPAAE